MAISGNSIDEIFKPELHEEYDKIGRAEFLSILRQHNRTPGLFKAEFHVTRMIALTSKCCYADTCGSAYGQGEDVIPKLSCKGVRKKQNPISWERHLEALNRSSNTGFRILVSGILTYTQSKLGLSAY